MYLRLLNNHWHVAAWDADNPPPPPVANMAPTFRFGCQGVPGFLMDISFGGKFDMMNPECQEWN